MDAIQKIIEEIDDQAKQERGDFQARETAAIDEWYEAEVKKINETHIQQLGKQSRDLEQKYKQQQSRQQMEIRQESLVEKQSYLDRLFEEAYEQMAAWNQETIRAFAEASLKKLPISDHAQLLPAGSNAVAALTTDFVDEVNETLAYTLFLGKPLEGTGEGFVIDVAGIQYNFLYRDLLKELRSTTGSEMTQKLFG
ncbi:hypothetical protein [Candidatus Enterococcus leclercqii]|uniref:hypothetical protein n=1 Tax=Candidatus Enterococcus leclercqii TaxID=1857218 RepID=UPI00137A2B54|nr:hypothetical protein [Enterococcus sp. CU9D]KAF1292269.1 hypothetical protein BAU14_07015 [Enterococcus sp. CU9D]